MVRRKEQLEVVWILLDVQEYTAVISLVQAKSKEDTEIIDIKFASGDKEY